MAKLPKTYEEYLQFQDLTDWPQIFPDGDEFNMSIQPDMFSSYESMSQYFREHAPFQMEVLDNMGQRIDQFVSKLEKYSSKILSDEPRQSKIKDCLFYAPSETVLTQMRASDALLTHPSRKLSEHVFAQNRPVKVTTVESQSFPGFKPMEFTELPALIEAIQLLNWIRKAQNFTLGFQNTWKKLILSDASAAILHDAFWWVFLFKFKPSKEDQDNLFNRIADSFVTLFMIAPYEVRDKFLEVYPDCIAQAIFAIFYKSFPDSHNKLDDEFKKELTELITLWMTGLRPEPFSWRKWNLEWLEKLISKRGPGRKETLLAALKLQSTGINLDFDLDELIKYERTPDIKDMSPPKTTAGLDAKMESSYAGPGPEFQHIFFRLSGRSPLVAHFLNMKKIMGRSLGTVGPKLKHSEISKAPPLAPTYQDVIKETQKISKELHRKYNDLHEQTRKVVAKIKWDQIQFNKKVDRLKNKLSNNADEFKHENELIPSKPVDIKEHKLSNAQSEGARSSSDQESLDSTESILENLDIKEHKLSNAQSEGARSSSDRESLDSTESILENLKDRKKGKDGGVALLIKDEISIIMRSDLGSEDQDVESI
ncbi:protein FAM227B-like [Heptranchias perlo]|uniref:protein FAM227B-like n=1 Tax=Heptranchias perlo TaxID=212740 RepID=UPI0035597CD8